LLARPSPVTPEGWLSHRTLTRGADSNTGVGEVTPKMFVSRGLLLRRDERTAELVRHVRHNAADAGLTCS
jgi:hypothetical protein